MQTILPSAEVTEVKKEEPFVIQNSMLKALHLVNDNCISITVKREAVCDSDVKECLDVFQEFLHTRLRPDQTIRILVNASDVHVSVLKIKIRIVHAFTKHFKDNLKLYLPHVNKCAIVVDSGPIAAFFDPLIKSILPDGKKIKVTANIRKAHQFLSST